MDHAISVAPLIVYAEKPVLIRIKRRQDLFLIFVHIHETHEDSGKRIL